MLLIETSPNLGLKNAQEVLSTPSERWDTLLGRWGVGVKMGNSLPKLNKIVLNFGKEFPIFTHTPQLPRGVSQRSDGVGRTSWAFYDPKFDEVSISNIFRGVWGIKNPP